MLIAALLAACQGGDGDGGAGRPTVVAGFFPLAEVARALADPGTDVVDLTPPGVEPHDMELSTRQVDRLHDADVVVVLGGGFQPAVERAARQSGGELVLVPAPDDDPHVWLDPVRMQDVVDRVAAALGEQAAARAGALKGELRRLHDEYAAGLATCRRRTLVTAHAAFGHLAARYGLAQEPITGVSPEAEPDPRRLAELADVVRRTGTTTVFTEALVSPRVAEALAREAGVRTDVLDPLESGEPGTYLAAMRGNLARLRTALGCT